MKGTVKRWFNKKGFGFITREDGKGDVFMHISDMNIKKPPRLGSKVTFDIEDDGGKPRAINIRFQGKHSSNLKKATIVFFTVVAILLGVHFTGLVKVPLPVLFYCVASLLAFVMFHADKRAAQKQHKRISEASLHLVELFGGWPGSFLASQFFRHKTIKGSYRIMLWSIVVIHIIAWWWLSKNGCALSCDIDTFLDVVFNQASSTGSHSP